MSVIIDFTLKELKKFVADKKSCVEQEHMTQELALQPWCLGNVPESIKKALDDKIGKFDKELNGILLSYKNLHLLQDFGAIRNDKTDIYFKIQADYFIFRPVIGATLKGIVNKKSSQHLGVLVHKVFNVVIPCPTTSNGVVWVGSRVKEGQEIVFKIVVLDLFGALPYIRGELVEKYLKIDDEDPDADKCFESVSNVTHVNFDKTKPKTVVEESSDQSESEQIDSVGHNCSIESNNANDNGTTKRKKSRKNKSTSFIDNSSTASQPAKKKKKKHE